MANGTSNAAEPIDVIAVDTYLYADNFKCDEASAIKYGASDVVTSTLFCAGQDVLYWAESHHFFMNH